MPRLSTLLAASGAVCALLLFSSCASQADAHAATKAPDTKASAAKPAVAKASIANNTVIGTWRDATLDKLKHLSDEDKKRMQGYMVFKANGTGEFITGGFRKASVLNTQQHWTTQTVPIKWTFKNGVVTLLSPDGKQHVLAFILASDGQTLSNEDDHLVYESFKGPIPSQDQSTP